MVNIAASGPEGLYGMRPGGISECGLGISLVDEMEKRNIFVTTSLSITRILHESEAFISH